jgi:hypothetical protein
MADFDKFDFIEDDEHHDHQHSHRPGELIEVTADIESIGHLTAKICAIWGTAELDSFLSHLILDSRDGKRAGFPMKMAAELMLLIDINKMTRAMDLARELNIGFDEAFKMTDERDQRSRKMDALDDPEVGADGIARDEKPVAAAAAPRTVVVIERHHLGLGGLILAVIQSKLFIGAVILILFVKLILPLFRG